MGGSQERWGGGGLVLKLWDGKFLKSPYIVGRGVLAPYFMKTSLYCLPLPLFQILSIPPTPLLPVLFLWLNGWSHQIWCAILFNHNNGSTHVKSWWYLSTRRTLMCVLCNKVSSLMRPGPCGFFTGTLIWHHTQANTQTHTAHSGGQ